MSFFLKCDQCGSEAQISNATLVAHAQGVMKEIAKGEPADAVLSAPSFCSAPCMAKWQALHPLPGGYNDMHTPAVDR